MTKILRKRHDLRTRKQQAISDWLNPRLFGEHVSLRLHCEFSLNMRLACLDLLECTAGKVQALRWVVVLQMSSVMFVNNLFEKYEREHSTETKSPQTAAFREKPTSATL